MLSLAHRILLRPKPAPFVGCQYITTLTTTADENGTSWTDVPLGEPHPKRLIALAIFQGVNGDINTTTSRVNNEMLQWRIRINEFSVAMFLVPTGTTGIVTVGASSSLRKAVSVYVLYPHDPIPTDSGSASATTTTDAVVSNIKVVNGGCLIYSGGQLSTLGAFSTTWNEVDTAIEDVDAQLESASSYTAGHINITRSSDNGDLTMAETVSGTKRLAVAAWGPPWRVAA